MKLHKCTLIINLSLFYIVIYCKYIVLYFCPVYLKYVCFMQNVTDFNRGHKCLIYKKRKSSIVLFTF